MQVERRRWGGRRGGGTAATGRPARRWNGGDGRTARRWNGGKGEDQSHLMVYGRKINGS
ncbi:unnamed protein product [Spirodela intermedia]|uniref:Uncharacterized protein n=1 Tax=Spirodela intermedia TaxID=51605 RepID=A0A7I8IU52_SPIIN|nr:unnamed protein product [Spirodela intermedia]CAA6661317.1 unnamed protein product [Spirodela intermedia]